MRKPLKPLRASLLNPGAVCFLFLSGVFVFLLRTTAQSPASFARTAQNTVAQQPHTPESSSGNDELVQSNSATTFKVRTDLVVVHVVVRDARGNTIGNLRKQDFELFDDHKQQIISNFSVETPPSPRPGNPGERDSSATEPGIVPATTVTFPQKFIAFYFDDLHLPITGVAQAVSAASKLLDPGNPSERFAVFTSSGHVEQDFTANRELLNAALGRMKPQPLQQNVSGPCPPHISYYQAYQIAELENTQVLHVVMDDFAQCPGSPGGKETLERYVRAEAQQQLSLGETDVRTGLLNLQSVIRRMGTLPGQRVIALLSPGFFVPSSTQDTNQVIDLATRAKVVLNAVDTRGVYLLDVGADATSRTIPSPDKIQVASVEQHVNGRVLSELADGTGGLFFHGRNDLDAGLLQATGEPEFSYVLGFSPRELKRDGKYHKLKVTVPANLHATVQARQGYFAPREPEDPEAAAEQEMELAVASRDSFSDVPIQCQTSIHQNVSGNFRLTVVARIDAKGFRFQRLADRNKDSVRVVAAIFDGNGNILTAKYNTVMMALRDSTLTTIAKTGIRARFEFDVQPGNYLLRVVARESEGPLMGAAELPVIVP